MNPEQQKAYEWAKNQNYQSVAAQHAKILADLITSLQADLARVTAERDAAVELISAIIDYEILDNIRISSNSINSIIKEIDKKILDNLCKEVRRFDVIYDFNKPITCLGEIK